MKHILSLFTIVIAMALSAVAQPQTKTLKMEMEYLHQECGVNFVYDSAIEINVPYSGKPMKDILKGRRTAARNGNMPTSVPSAQPGTNTSVRPSIGQSALPTTDPSVMVTADPSVTVTTNHPVMPDPDRASNANTVIPGLTGDLTHN